MFIWRELLDSVKEYYVKRRKGFWTVIAVLAICRVGFCLPREVVRLGIEPLWNVGVITDTQTSEYDWISALIGRLKADGPDMVIHTGDTYFEWGNRFVLKTVADLVRIEGGALEFHLAPGNHDMHNGVLKAHLRRAATRGVFRLDRGITFRGENYLQSRVAAYVPGPLLPVWNPEIVNHPGWQVDASAKLLKWGDSVAGSRYVFKRGGIRFIVCDWSYSTEQRAWLRNIITQPDDSSVSIVLHHAHQVHKLSRYFEGLEGRHNVKLVLSGHDHQYYQARRDGITYITGAGIARSNRDCDAMILRVYRGYLRLDRYIIPKGSLLPRVVGPEPIWMCEGSFSEYRRPEFPRRTPAYVRSTTLGPGVFYERAK